MALISIVISMYNRNPGIVDTVEGLLFPSLLNNASSNKQLILVNDKSPQDKETKEIVERFESEAEQRFGDFQYVDREENLGFSQSYNEAASRAEGRILVISNADVYFPEDSIERLAIKALSRRSQVGPVTNGGWGYQTTNYFKFPGKHVPDYSTLSKNKLEAAGDQLVNFMPVKPNEVNSLSGFCFALPQDRFIELDGFDEQLATFWNDTDLSRRVRQETPVYVDGSTYIYHHDQDSLSNQPFKGNIKVLGPFIADGFRYMKKWHDYVTAPVDFAWRTVQNMFYVKTIGTEIKKNCLKV